MAAWLFVCLSLSVLLASAGANVSSPLVLIPGILGNQIEGKLDKSNVPHSWCYKHTSGWMTLWFGLLELLPEEVDCLSDNLLLHYNETSSSYSNTEGVQTRVPGFGQTDSVEYLDPNLKWFEPTQYYYKLIDHFVSKGYQRGVNIVGAPYDWRYAPDNYLKQGYFAQLQKLIEDTYKANGNSKVVLIAHSMGAPTSLYFLTRVVSPEWKEMHIRMYITLSGVWRGAAKAAKAFISGDNEGIVIDKDIWGRANSRSYPSTAWLLPMPTDTWGRNDIIAFTPAGNFSAWDYKDMFEAINYTRGFDMFNEVRNLTSSLPAPNVTVHCFYGQDMDTPWKFHYSASTFPDGKPVTEFSDGDGTVNIDSLRACGRWQQVQDQKKHPVTLRGFSKVEHVHTIKNPDIIQAIDDILYS